MEVYGIPGINGLGKTKGLEVSPLKFLDESKVVSLDKENLELQGKQIYDFASELSSERRKIFLGGDHSISYPLLRSFLDKFSEGKILVFDAHPDLMPHMEEPTHEEWLRGVIEELGVSGERVMIVGVRKNSENVDLEEINYAKEKKVRIIFSDEFDSKKNEIREFVSGLEKVYCSFDFDVFDSSVFSATGYPEEEGLGEEEILKFIEEIRDKFFWTDLVEYNFLFDHDRKGFEIVEKVLKTLYEDYSYED